MDPKMIEWVNGFRGRQMRFRRKPKAPKKFRPPAGNFFFFAVCFFTQNTQNCVENSQMGEEHKKHFTPDPTSVLDVG